MPMPTSADMSGRHQHGADDDGDAVEQQAERGDAGGGHHHHVKVGRRARAAAHVAIDADALILGELRHQVDQTPARLTDDARRQRVASPHNDQRQRQARGEVLRAGCQRSAGR